MRIKKFTAESVPEALRLVKKDMGNDAVILNTRELSRMFSRNGARSVEVTAAVDLPDASGKSAEKKKSVTIQPNRLTGVLPSTDSGASLKALNTIDSAPVINQANTPPNSHIAELNRVREIIGEKDLRISAEKYLELMPGEIGKLYRLLPWLNLHPDVIDDIAMATISGSIPGTVDDSWQNRWAKYLAGKCGSSESLTRLMKKEPIAFTGLAGCGRSALIVKIAHRYINREKLGATIISMDNYNVSGGHQLRRIAKLLGVRFLATTRVKELKQHISKFNSKEPILLDLPALNGTDDSEKEILQQLSNIQLARVLVVNAMQHFKITEETISRAQQYKLTHVAFTHYGESNDSGAILNTLLKSKLRPLAGGSGRSLTTEPKSLSPEEISAALFSGMGQEKSYA